MKLSLLIMAAASTLVLAGGGGGRKESIICKKCDIYRLEHCEKDVCEKKVDGAWYKKETTEWKNCMDDCEHDDVCKYVPEGETATCSQECVYHVLCPLTRPI